MLHFKCLKLTNEKVTLRSFPHPNSKYGILSPYQCLRKVDEISCWHLHQKYYKFTLRYWNTQQLHKECTKLRKNILKPISQKLKLHQVNSESKTGEITQASWLDFLRDNLRNTAERLSFYSQTWLLLLLPDLYERPEDTNSKLTNKLQSLQLLKLSFSSLKEWTFQMTTTSSIT